MSIGGDIEKGNFRHQPSVSSPESSPNIIEMYLSIISAGGIARPRSSSPSTIIVSPGLMPNMSLALSLIHI